MTLTKHLRKQVEPHTVTLTPETWIQIRTIALQRQVSCSDVVRHLLALGLAAYTASQDA